MIQTSFCNRKASRWQDSWGCWLWKTKLKFFNFSIFVQNVSANGMKLKQSQSEGLWENQILHFIPLFSHEILQMIPLKSLIYVNINIYFCCWITHSLLTVENWPMYCYYYISSHTNHHISGILCVCGFFVFCFFVFLSEIEFVLKCFWQQHEIEVFSVAVFPFIPEGHLAIYEPHSVGLSALTQSGENRRRSTVTCTLLNAGICKNLFQAFHIRSTPPASPSGMWRKFEKNIQNLLLVICMPRGARLLSIAPFFQPFDILLDVAVCLRCSSDTYCSLFHRQKGVVVVVVVRGCQFIKRMCGVVLHTNTEQALWRIPSSA